MKKYFGIILLFIFSSFSGACTKTYVTTQQGSTYNEYKAKSYKKVTKKKKKIKRGY